jgi:hypothetical protein
MKKPKKPGERTPERDVSEFSTTNLVILCMFISRDSKLANEFRYACIAELEKRGELIFDAKRFQGERPHEFKLPDAERAKLLKHFTEGRHCYSLEHILFTQVLQVPNPWLAMTVDLTQLSSANLAILRTFTYGYTPDHVLPIDGAGNRLRRLCGDELTRRGHLIIDDEDYPNETESYQLPPEEQAILIKHLGPSFRSTSIEDDIFTKILQLPNPWSKGGDKRKRK